MNTKELIGKTIKAANIMQKQGYDDTGYLKLEFTDGTFVVIVSFYDEEYTRNSEGEYPTRIELSQDDNGLIPIDKR